MVEMSKSALDILDLYLNDFPTYARECLVVRNHNTAKLEPLIFRPGQMVMHDVAEKRKAEVGYIRMILLKNRRFGGSTYIGGRGYHKTSMNFNQNAFIIAHEEPSTTTLFKMVQLMQEKNPIAPPTKTSNARELIFDTPGSKYGLKSEYQLATAKNVEAGRSQGIHFLHCSEEALWPGHSDELLSSLFQCFPRPPDRTEIWRESTGRGYGNSFQISVFDAWSEGRYPYFTALISDYAKHMPAADVEFTFAYHNPESDWVLIFIPWFLDPSCCKGFESEERKREFIGRIDAAEKKPTDTNYKARKIQSKYRLSLEQLYWREHNINTDCHGKVELFNQENPTTILDAFRTKGVGHYPADLCDIVERGCLSPVTVGNIVRRFGTAAVEPNPNGHVQIWERYNLRDQYFLTVDAAGGKREIHIREKREPDRTVVDVWNHRTGRQAAQWYGHVDYDMIDTVVEAMGEMYGRGTACVELNNHGYTVVGNLKKKEYPLYYYKPGEAGWSTNKKTKPEMADGLLDGCRAGLVTIRCRETVAEMRTFVEIDGKYGGESGCKDDRVTSAQMACQMMEKLPRRSELQDEPKVRPSGYRQSESSWMAS